MVNRAGWTRGGQRDQPQLQRRDGRLIDLLAEIAAPVRGITKDALVGEELRQHRRTVRTAVTAASLLLVLAIAAVLGALLTLDQRDEAESRRQQALSQSLAGQATDVGRAGPTSASSSPSRPGAMPTPAKRNKPSSTPRS